MGFSLPKKPAWMCKWTHALTFINPGPLHTRTHTTTCVHSLNVCSCGRGWLILSNSMATLHLPTGTLVFNYQRFIPLAPLLRIATSTDKLMEHLITVLLTAVCAVFSEIRMRKCNIFITARNFFFLFFSAAQLCCQRLLNEFILRPSQKLFMGRTFDW